MITRPPLCPLPRKTLRALGQFDRKRTETAAQWRPHAQDNGVMREVEIRDDAIRLGQLLKLAGLAEQGADAKALLEAGEVRVNDEVETRRGRQLAPGDRVALGDEVVRITTP
jgi:ribosome-associated protein